MQQTLGDGTFTDLMIAFRVKIKLSHQVLTAHTMELMNVFYLPLFKRHSTLHGANLTFPLGRVPPF